MRTTNTLLSCLVLVGGLGLSTAAAQEVHEVYNRERGELSPGTAAPTREVMLNTIRANGSATALTAMLEYGERVECFECIPLLEAKLLDSDDARVREIAAWWLRRRPFGFGRAVAKMRDVVINDGDAVRRSRAAEALGEFLDPGGLAPLSQAAREDGDARVRVSAVRALGRLNVAAGNPILAEAFADDAVEVRRAAVDQVTKVNFFSDFDALLGRLDDSDVRVRTRAAQLVGELGVDEATAPLAGLLLSDDEPVVRQAAAWALGRLGGSDAREALRDALVVEEQRQVLDAIEIALKM